MSGTTTKGTISTVRFALIIVAIIGLGLAGVLVVTTSIGAQANELTKLQTEAKKLEYESASLRTQLEGLSSTGSLAMRASELNMVPNPYPAFVMLDSGKVLGEPTKVRGNEFPELRRQKPQPTPTPPPSPSPVVTPSPVPPTPKPEEHGERPEDVIAAQQPAAPQPSASPVPSPTPTTQPTSTPGGE